MKLDVEPRESFLDWLDQTFGHARALEALLILIKFIFAIGIWQTVFPIMIMPLQDYLWYISRFWIAFPFFIVAIGQTIGVILNRKGVCYSWMLRAGGGAGGMLLWIFLFLKDVSDDHPSTGTSLFCIGLFVGSCFIFWKAINKKPPARMI